MERLKALPRVQRVAGRDGRTAGVFRLARVALVGALAIGTVLMTRPAAAIPAFARKYGTSCTTCHVIYPKLNPFGAAFRRNGFRFPGVDSDVVSEKTISMGRDAYKKIFPKAVWPGTLPGSVPLAFGANGQIVFHPDSKSGAAAADNKARVVLGGLVDEVHIWAGGSFDDTITYFAEVTASEDGVEVEHAYVIFNDLFGPKHAVNLTVGKAMPTLNSFGMHSSYINDMALPGVKTDAFGGISPDHSYSIVGDYNLLEVHGVLAGHFDYSVGITQGVDAVTRAPQDVYAHIGYKIGGVRLDGENGSAVKNPMEPWAENALTIDLFGSHSSTRYAFNSGTAKDISSVIGATVRAQWRSLEFDAGVYNEWHTNVGGAGLHMQTMRGFGELSYVVYPWLVPAVRFGYTRFAPKQGPKLYDVRVTPGVEALIRPNLKLSLTVPIEFASAAPGGDGWLGMDDGVGQAAGKTSGEVESITLGIAYAY